MNEETKTVLVIDDEEDFTNALTLSLEYEGYNVLKANTGEKGVELALTEKPDIILLDISMPEVDGIDVLRKIRADSWGISVRIIMVSAHDNVEQIADVLESGAYEYISKTKVTLSEVVAKVKAALKQ